MQKLRTKPPLVSLSEKFVHSGEAAVHDVLERSKQAIESGDTEHRRLVAQLNDLEGKIKDAIERATGFTLFHAFQRRQQDIVKAKNFWAWALSGCVALSVLLALVFIVWVLPEV